MRVFDLYSGNILEVPARDSQEDLFYSHVSHVERCPPSRLRRRGPRSLQAIVRRVEQRFTPSAVAPGKSGAVSLADTPADVPNSDSLCNIATDLSTEQGACVFEVGARRLRVVQPSEIPCEPINAFCESVRVWSINCRKFLTRKAEIEARLRNSKVDIVCLQETWLSDSVEEISLSGYTCVGRFDRALGPKCGYGGIAVFARTNITDIALVEYINGAERMWCVLHTNIGALLIGNWYRPPDEDGNSISILQAEIERLRSECVGVILLGDINIHHKRWLRYSSKNTITGERLWEVCRDLGLKQIVAKPTRGEYLLDLILTDAANLCKVEVLPEISDHRIVCLDIEVTVSYAEQIPRTVWDMKHANWDSLRHDISMQTWKDLFDEMDPDGSVKRFCDALCGFCNMHIPQKSICTKAVSHPWLDDECLAAVAEKALAAGSAEFEEKAMKCSNVLRDAFVSYRARLRERIGITSAFKKLVATQQGVIEPTHEIINNTTIERR